MPFAPSSSPGPPPPALLCRGAPALREAVEAVLGSGARPGAAGEAEEEPVDRGGGRPPDPALEGPPCKVEPARRPALGCWELGSQGNGACRGMRKATGPSGSDSDGV